MSGICIEFLQSISGPNSPMKRHVDYSINSTHKNKMYQQVLETMFGNQEGSTTSTITENEVLTLGVKSFYLKLAIYSSSRQCYKFLDYIYAAIQAEKPGHYWELLIAIKTINDHCNNAQIRHTIDNLEYNNIPCYDLFFKNIGNGSDMLPVAVVQPALRTIIVKQIKVIAATASIRQIPYTTQQVVIAKELDNLKPNPNWRFMLNSVTGHQYMYTDPETINLFKNKTEERQLLIATKISEHQAVCDEQMCQLRITVEINQELDKQISDAEKMVMVRDFRRYNEELIILKEIKEERNGQKCRPTGF